MTTPTVPPTPCPIEVDPLAAPCGTGLENWGGSLPEPMVVCLNGVTVTVTDVAGYQQAVMSGSFGACAAAGPVATVAEPAGLPVTGAGHAVGASFAGVLLAAGVVLVRLAHR